MTATHTAGPKTGPGTTAGAKPRPGTGPDPAPAPDPAEDTEAARGPVISWPVSVELLIGITAGTVLAVIAISHHITVPGLHGFTAPAATWALLVVLVSVAADLLRRYHRAMARAARRHSWRGVLYAVWRGGRLYRYLAAWARERWENREHGPLVFHRHPADDDPEPAADPPPPDPPPGPPPDPTSARPPFTAVPAGTSPHSPRPTAPPPPPDPTERTPGMADTRVYDHTRPPTAPGGRRTPATRASGRKVPAVFRPVIAFIDDFEPANDAELHDFLLGLAAGLHDVGASLADLYELCTSPGIRVGKGGMAATHAAADSIADASSGVSGASQALEAYYAGVSDEVAAGVELPRDGDFVTGEGASS